MSVTTFHFFPRLPPELRSRIWYFSFPSPPKSALLPYRQGLWDIQLDSSTPGAHITLSFDFARLVLSLPAPIQAAASSEAHNAALHWASQNQMHLSESKSGYTRSFDPEQDILYIPKPLMIPFVLVMELENQPQMKLLRSTHPPPHCLLSPVQRIAIRAEKLGAKHVQWSKLWQFWPKIRRIDVIIGEGGEAEDGGVWTVEDAGCRWLWRRGYRATMDRIGDVGMDQKMRRWAGYRGDGGTETTIEHQMDKVGRIMAKGLQDTDIDQFEVVLVKARRWGA